MLSILTKHGYTQSEKSGIRPKPYRPKSIGDGRKIIAEVFERSRWDEGAQERYFAMKGIEATKLADLTAEDIRTVLASMEQSHQILFAD